jgi:hypothetical protein
MKRVLFNLLGVVFFFSLWATSAWCLVTSPALEELVPAGSAYAIEWEAIPGATAYNVFVSYDNKATWEKINGAEKVGATTCDWSVNPLIKTRLDCFVRVVGFDGTDRKVGNVLSSAFTVSVLDLITPGLGESIDAGSLYEITWDTTTQVSVSGANLSYSTDGGGTWKSLVQLGGNPGAYTWTVPQLAATSKQCKVRVVLTDDLSETVARAVTPIFTIKVTKMTLKSMDAESYAISFTVDGPQGGPNTAGADFLSASWDGAGHLHGHVEDSFPNPPDPDDDAAYSVAADGQVSIIGGGIHGIASKDAGLVLLQDTNNGDSWIESLLMIKKSSGLDNSVLDGIYVMGEFGQTAEGTKYATLLQVTFGGDGTATTHCLSDSRGCAEDVDFAYLVQDDGRVDFPSLGYTGVVDSTGDIFTTGNLGSADGGVSIGFGLRQPDSTFSESTLAGKFIATSLGYTSDNTRFNTCVAKLNMDGAGNMSITDIYLSSPPPENGEGTYEVLEDEEHGLTLLHVGDWVEYYTGAISRDGQVFFVVDTNTDEFDDHELGLTVGLKKAK